MTQKEIEEKLNEFSDKNKISKMIFEKANENNLSIEETKQLIIESNKAESAVPKKGLNEEFFQNFLRQIGIKRVFNFIKNSQKESQPIAQLQAIITLFKDILNYLKYEHKENKEKEGRAGWPGQLAGRPVEERN